MNQNYSNNSNYSNYSNYSRGFKLTGLFLMLFLTVGIVAFAKWEGGVSGIVFFNTKQLEKLKTFYIDEIGCTMWMDQKDCVILKFGNMLIGFCQRDKADLDALITFFYEKKSEVDKAYEKFKAIAQGPPKMNPRYPIYNFFAKDPEGRNIEFQYFTGPIDWDFSK